MKKINIFISSFYFAMLLSMSNLFSQTGSIIGQLTDGYEPIVGANIILLNTNIGTTSDFNGRFKLNKIPTGTYVLRISSIGYETKEITVDIKSNKTVEINEKLNSKPVEVDEIKIIAQRKQNQTDSRISVLEFKPKQAVRLPGAAQDVLRSLQSLPGVVAPNDFSSQIVVRGSGPDQNLIILDDVEIFNPYRLYGVISMFNPETVSQITLITGGFPAKYGDRLSATLDVVNREGNRNSNISGMINANIVSANVIFEGKNPFNLPGSWLINSRRTYYDLIVEPFVKRSGLIENDVSFPNFHDIQAKFVIGPFDGNKFIFNGIYSRDGVKIISSAKRTTPDSIAVQDLTKNDVLSFAWHLAPTNNFLNKFIVSWYRNSGLSEFDGEILDPTLRQEKFDDPRADSLKSYLYGFGFDSEYIFEKVSLDNKFNYIFDKNDLEMGAGIDFIKTYVDLDIRLSPELKAIFDANPNIRSAFNNLFKDKNYYRFRAYAQNKFKISSNFYFSAGLRFDLYQIIEKNYISPRFSFSYIFNDITTLRGAYGIYYQSPGYEKVVDQGILYDFDKKHMKNIEAERAKHYALSLERYLDNYWKIKAETYYKDFDNLIVRNIVKGTAYKAEIIAGKDIRYKDGWTRPQPLISDSVTNLPVNGSYGKAYGFEFMLEKTTLTELDKLSGWISYSLAWADRFERKKIIPFRYDQRHTFNLVLNYKINSYWEVGIKQQYGSGFPYTKPIGIKPRIIMTDQNLDLKPETPEIATRSNNEVIFEPDYGIDRQRFNARKPAYHRMDVRINYFTKLWRYDATFYLDIVNVYNRKNVIGYSYRVDKNLNLTRETNTMLPILPTLGFSLKF